MENEIKEELKRIEKRIVDKLDELHSLVVALASGLKI